MSKFKVGDTVRTKQWGDVVVDKLNPEYPHHFYASYTSSWPSRGTKSGMFKDDDGELIEPAEVQQATDILDNTDNNGWWDLSEQSLSELDFGETYLALHAKALGLEVRVQVRKASK